MSTTRTIQMSALSVALMACARASTFTEDGTLAPVPGTVMVSGRVTSSDGTPVADANVTTPTGRTTTTDHDGRYSLSDVTPGRSTVVVSRSGFATANTKAKFSTKKSDGDRNRVDVTLLTPDEVVALSAREASDSATLDRNGFLGREASVRGAYFVTPEDIAELHPRTISDVFRRVPVMIEPPALMGSRLPGGQGCFITYLNALPRNVRSPSDLETFVPTRSIMAAEVYPPGQLPPAPFSRAGYATNCTTVVVWTRS